MEFANQMKKVHEETKATLTLAQETMKQNYDRKKGDSCEYQIRDEVWLEGTNISTNQPIKKLDNKHHGPFKILGEEGELAYRLELPKTWKKIHPVFNEKFLSPFTPAQYPSQQLPKPVPPIIVEGFEEYKIDELMDSKFSQGKLQYLIKWKDYPNRIDWTWEPKNKILPDNRNEFHEKHPSAPQRITAQLKFKPIPQSVTEVEVRQYTWPEGKEFFPDYTPNLKNEDAFIPLNLQHFDEMESQKKTAEYQNYWLPDTKQFWLVNTGQS
jgi:hypothetical protein